MRVPLLDLKGQYAPMREEIREVIDEVCDSQYFILGPRVEAFEKNIADYCGTEQAVGVSSGTDALIVALMALDVGPGDAVITTPYTFYATYGSIVRLGATPIAVDIDPVTFNIDPEKCREILTSMPDRFSHLTPKVIMPVHLYGQCADMTAIKEIASEYNLKIVEDCAQAIGAECPIADSAKKAGSIGDIGCYSFFPSKNLGGFGDGGMVVTDDGELAEKMRWIRVHGMSPKYYHSMIGGNFRLDALQAAVLDVKLKYLEGWHAGRRANAEYYDNKFAGTALRTPEPVYKKSGLTNYHIYNQYIIRMEDRDEVMARLKNADVGCDIYYPVPLHLQECFKDLGYKEGDMPQSEQAAAESLAIPVYPELTDEMKDFVVEIVVGV